MRSLSSSLPRSVAITAPLAALAIALAVLPAPVRANGGPVAEGDMRTGGGITPLERDDIDLVEEKATIKLSGTAEQFWVDARYVLSNPKGPKTLLFGVPFLPDVASFDSDPGIRIDVGREAVKCTLRPASELKGNLRPLGDLQREETPKSWCVASITVPAGTRVPLRLRYKDSTNFEDNEFSESRLADHHPRELTYDLYPAGYWGGADASVSITVDLSALPGIPVKATPSPTATTPERLQWQIRGRDLRRLGRLALSIDMSAVQLQRELLTLNRSIKKARARASSVLTEGSDAHAPGLVADGKAGTAWCEGVDGDGMGEWIELAFKPELADADETGKRPPCRLEGFGLVPGWARAGSYLENGRVRRIRISACGGRDPGIDVGVAPPSDRPEQSATSPADLPPALRDQLYECLRVTILDVAPGSRQHDTCIGEIIPVFNCEGRGQLLKRRPPPF